MGSAAKGTIIRPIDDIDVLAVFSNSRGAWTNYRSDSRTFLYRIRRAYDGYNTQQVGARGQAVRVFYQSGGHVDVAPVFSAGDGVFKLPAGDGTWIDTAPVTATNWFLGKDAAVSYRLAPLVRLAKSWNREHSQWFRSFHLETVAASSFETIGTDYRTALTRLFEWAPSHLDVEDPGGRSGRLSTYWTSSARQSAVTALQLAATRGQRALDYEAAGNHTEAKRLWRLVLGEAFPLR